METRQCSAADVNDKSEANDFTDDLLMEIFSYLPLKPLFRFKCVSKAWYNLISNYSCQARVLESVWGFFYSVPRVDEIGSMEETEYGCACLPSDRAIYGSNRHISMNVSLNFLPFYPNFRIVDCSNGLLLLCGISETRGDVYYVCNPLLRRWVPLPKAQTKGMYVHSRLGYDPVDSPHFKVILSADLVSPGHLEVWIFSSSTGSWDQFEVSYDSCACFEGPLLFFREALYFLSFPYVVLRVDLRKGSYEEFRLPEQDRIAEGFVHKSAGHLYYIRFERRYIGNAVEHWLKRWLLKDYETSDWITVHESCISGLEMERLLTCPHDSRKNPELLEFGAGVNAVFLNHCKILSLDLDTKRVHEVCNFGSNSGDDPRLAFYPFVYRPCLNTLEYHKLT